MAEHLWFAVRMIVADNENQPWGLRDPNPGEIDDEELPRSRPSREFVDEAKRASAVIDLDCRAGATDHSAAGGSGGRAAWSEMLRRAE